MEAGGKQCSTFTRRNDLEPSVASKKFTFTFEKRKVPQRGRTNSLQSVFSGISLKSIMQNNNDKPGNICEENSSHMTRFDSSNLQQTRLCDEFINKLDATQQIQSPAVVSFNMGFTNVIKGDREGDLKIGECLPFRDTSRTTVGTVVEGAVLLGSGNSGETSSNMDVNPGGGSGASVLTYNVSAASASYHASGDSLSASHKLNDTPVSGDFSINEQKNSCQTDVDLAKQEELKNNSLQKLSMLQVGKTSFSIDINLLTNKTVDSTENPNELREPLTHLQFGDKHVILETSKRNSIPFIQSPGFMSNSLWKSPFAEVLTQSHPLTQLNTTQPNYNDNGDKECSQIVAQKHIEQHQDLSQHREQIQSQQQLQYTKKMKKRQINEPKKPLYMPAVLRDISETNITLHLLNSLPSVVSTDSDRVSSFQKNQRSSYVSTIHSATLSFFYEYRRKFDLWFGYGRNKSSKPAQYLNMVPPTRRHWVSDDKRQSCKYCHKLFTFWERKHHCRYCGDIFCQQHVIHWLYLNPDAKFIIGGGGLGMLSKICDGCLKEYEKVVKEGPISSSVDSGFSDKIAGLGSSTFKVGHNQTKLLSTNTHNSSATSTTAGEIRTGDSSGRQLLDNFVGSVPADWFWSSF